MRNAEGAPHFSTVSGLPSYSRDRGEFVALGVLIALLPRTRSATIMVCQYRHAKLVTAWSEPNMGLGNDVTGTSSFFFFLMLAIGIPSDPLSPRPHEYTRFSARKFDTDVYVLKRYPFTGVQTIS